MTRTLIQSKLQVFQNLQSFGKTSIIAIDYHPSFSGNQTPFSIFAADYDDTQANPSAFTNRLKISNNTTSATTFTVFDTGGGAFTAVNALDYHIDALDASASSPGTLINKYAVSVRENALTSADGNTVLIDANGVVQPVNGSVNPSTMIQTMFTNSNWGLASDGGIDRQYSLKDHLSSFASRNRVFVRSDRVLMLNGTNASATGAFTSTNWTDLKIAGSSTNYSPNNTWIDFATYSEGVPFLRGKPVIFQAGLFVPTATGTMSVVSPFRVDVTANTNSFASFVTNPNDPLRYIDKSTSSPVDPSVLQQRWIAGQMAPSAASAFTLGLNQDTLIALSAYDDGAVFLTNSGVYKVSLSSMYGLNNNPIVSSQNRLAIPDFAQYIDIKAAGSDGNKDATGASVIYLVMMRTDCRLDVAKVKTIGSQVTVNTMTIPLFICSMSVDRMGHLAVVDNQIHEVWWTNIDNLGDGKPYLFGSNTQFDYTYLTNTSNNLSQDKTTAGSVAAQSDVAATMAQLTALQTSASALRSQIASNPPNVTTLQAALSSVMSNISQTIDNTNASLACLQTHVGNNPGQISSANITSMMNSLLSQVQSFVSAQNQNLTSFENSITTLFTQQSPAVGITMGNLQVDSGSAPADFSTRLENMMSQLIPLINAEADTLSQLIHQTQGTSAQAAILSQKQAFVANQSAQITNLSSVSDLYQAQIDRINTTISGSGTTADQLSVLTQTQLDYQVKQFAILNAEQELINELVKQLSADQHAELLLINNLAANITNAASLQAQLNAANSALSNSNQALQQQAQLIQASITAQNKSITSLQTAAQVLQQILANAPSGTDVGSVEQSLSAQLDAIQKAMGAMLESLTDFNDQLAGAFSSVGLSPSFITIVQSQISSTVTGLNSNSDQQSAIMTKMQNDRNNAVASLGNLINSSSTLPDNAGTIQSMITSYSQSFDNKLTSQKATLNSQLTAVQAQLTTVQNQINDLTNQQNAVAQNNAAATSTPSSSSTPDAAQSAMGGDIASQLATLNPQLASLKQQVTDLNTRLTKAQTDHDAEVQAQQGFLTAYTAASNALTTAMNTAVDPRDLSAMVNKLQLISNAKDQLIATLGVQVVNLQNEISNNNATISALQTTENSVRANVTALLASQTPGSGTLTPDQQALVSGNNANNISLTDLVPLLSSLVDTKNKMIAQLQQQLQASNADNATLTTANQQLTASLAQKDADNSALQSSANALSAAMLAAANQPIDGTTDLGTVSFTANESLMDQFNAVMALRAQQLKQVQQSAQAQSDAYTNQISQLSQQLSNAQQASASLQATADADAQNINNLTAQVAQLQQQLAASQSAVTSANTAMTQQQQVMQQTIDAINAQNAKLNQTIADKQAIIDSQTATMAQKDQAIADQTALAKAYATQTAQLQTANQQLASQLSDAKSQLAAQALVLQKAQGDLSLSQQQVASLTAQLAALAQQQQVTDAAYQKQIDALTALNNQNNATIANLQQTQVTLTNQVSTLSTIVDEHVTWSELTASDQTKLQSIMSGMSSDESSLVMDMINGTIDTSQLAPYCVLWFDQDFGAMTTVYTNTDATKPDASLLALETAKISGTTSGIFGMISDLLSLHSFLYAYTSVPSYTVFTSDKVTLLNKYLPDIQTLISTALKSTDPATQLKTFRGSVSNEIYTQLKSTLIVKEITAWNSSPYTLDAKKTELLTILTGTTQALQMAMMQVKVNAALTQQQATMQLQQQNADAVATTLQQQADAAKAALTQAMATNAADLQKAQATYTATLNAQNQALANAQTLANQLAATLQKASAASTIDIKMIQRQATQGNQSKSLSFYQTRISTLTSQEAALNTIIAQGAGDPNKTQTMLNEMMAEENRLQYDMEYMPYVLPLAQKYASDGSIVKYAQIFDLTNTGTNVTLAAGQQLYTETGLDEFGVSENVVIGWIDPNAGTANYLDTASIDSNGFVTLSANNRFTSTVSILAVNRGDNSVSFECNSSGKHLILTLVPSTATPVPPAGLSAAEIAAFTTATASVQMYTVQFLPLAANGKLVDGQQFYAEGADKPAYPEAVILRTCSTANGFANDMQGYLSVTPPTTSSGVYKLVYAPYISADYHSQPGCRETIFGMVRLDAASGTDDANLLAAIAGGLDSKDKTKVVDPSTGYTAYDQAMAALLQPLQAKLPTIANNPDKFEDLALTVAEFVVYRQINGLLSATDLIQFKNLAQEISKHILTSANGLSLNLSTNSAGYKALFGAVDSHGKPVAGSGGLINQTMSTSQVMTFNDGDYLVFSSSGLSLCFGSGTDAVKSVDIKVTSTFDRYANFKLSKDSASGNFRLLAHPSFGDFKISIDNTGAAKFVPLSTTTGSDLFALAGTSSATSISVTGATPGYLAIANNALTYVSNPAATSATSSTTVTSIKPGFTFSVAHNTSGSFRAKLVDLAGQAVSSDGTVKLSDLVAAELARDNTQANQTITDVTAYLKAFVTASNQSIFTPIVQALVSAIAGSSLASKIDPALLMGLENNLSLFHIEEATYFIIQDKDGLVLVNEGMYNDTIATTVGGTSQKLTYSALDFVQSAPCDKASVIRIIPHPTQPSTFLLVTYLAGSGLPVYLQAKSVSVTDSNNNNISLTTVTGSDASSYDKDGSVSQNQNEWFAISGTNGALQIRSLAAATANVGYASSITDSVSAGLIQQQIQAQNSLITTTSASITDFTNKIAQANVDITSTQTSLTLTSTNIISLNTQISTLASQLKSLTAQGKKATDPDVVSNASLTLTATTSLATAQAQEVSLQQALKTLMTNKTTLQGSLATEQATLVAQQATLAALNASLNFKRLAILQSATDISNAGASTTFSVTALNAHDVTLMLASVNQLPDTFYNLLLNISHDTTLTDTGKTAAADEAFAAFQKVLFVDPTVAEAKLVIKPYLINNNITTITTNQDSGIYSMQDTLSDIKSDFKYAERTHDGINFSANAMAILATLEKIFVPEDSFAINDDNLTRILTFGDQDLITSLTKYQTDKVNLRAMLTPVISYIKKNDIVWVDSTGTVLTDDTLASNTTDLVVQDFDVMVARADLTDTIKGVLSYKLGNLLSSNTITDSTLKALLTGLLIKIDPNAAAVQAPVTAAPTTYAAMSLYDRLDLAENMINGRYQDLTGKLIQTKNLTEANNVLNTITATDLANSSDPAGMKAWLIQLQALANVSKTTASVAAKPVSLSMKGLKLSSKKSGSSSLSLGSAGSSSSSSSSSSGTTTAGSTKAAPAVVAGFE